MIKQHFNTGKLPTLATGTVRQRTTHFQIPKSSRKKSPVKLRTDPQRPPRPLLTPLSPPSPISPYLTESGSYDEAAPAGGSGQAGLEVAVPVPLVVRYVLQIYHLARRQTERVGKQYGVWWRVEWGFLCGVMGRRRDEMSTGFRLSPDVYYA